MSVSSKYHIPVFGICILLITAVGLFLFSFLFVATPVLSHSSGFYEDEFELTISVPLHSEIYYTLDGSLPDENSFRYTGPVTIVDNSNNPNTHSMRTDVSAGFRTDLIDLYKPNDSNYTYYPPDHLIDKCTVIRVIAINSLGLTSEIISASYFVDIPPARYQNCNVLSLISDPDNLFDYETGIYVTGSKFEQYMKKNELSPNWRGWNANYRQRGSSWERDAIFHFFDSSGQLFLEEKGGIRVRGGISRATLPRSLNLYARDKHNANDTFGFNLFGNDYIPASISLTSGGNQLITQFNDYMMTQRVRNLNIATTLFEPYVLFLDGEYWGFYWLSEKFDETYFEHYYGVDPNNCIIVKNESLEAGRDGDLDFYYKMLDYITTNDMSVPENYAKASELIDVDSCIDYFATMAYIARYEDWPYNNWSMWRTRISENVPCGDTRWRWILYDCNSASMSSYMDNTNHFTLDTCLQDPIFASLWNNYEFCLAFRDRILEIADTNFNAHEMDLFIREYTEKMEPILAKSWKRFHGSNNDKYLEYHEKMDRIHHFFMNRKTYVETWFKPEEN